MKNNYGVVIVTYNRLDLLKECIEAVNNQNVSFNKIIIINNSSSDGTFDYLMSYSDKSKYVIFNSEENLGGAGGFAKGIDIAKDLDLDWLLIIDDDAIISQDYIKEIDEYVKKDKYVAYSGTVTTDGKIDFTHRKYIKNKYFMKFSPVPEENYANKTFECDLCTFCGLVVSMDIVNEIGLPNINYFIWYDDTEYSLRIGKYSKILNINSAILNHKTIISTERVIDNWKSYYGYRNYIDVGNKYSSNPFLFKLYIWNKHFIQIIYASLLFVYKKDERYKYKIQMHIDVLRDSFNNILGKNDKYIYKEKRS